MQLPLVGLVLLWLCALPSCTIVEWFEARQARDELRACQEAYPDDPEACADLREASDESYEDYEDQAQRDWGCGDTEDPCTPWQDD